MGHYDDIWEEEYKERRLRSKQTRNAVIPEILEALNNAEHKLAVSIGDIKEAKRMISEINYIKLALEGQITND